MANREDTIKKIKALRAKAADAAATEAEAMQAAEMAARLMTRNDISPEELVEVEKSAGATAGFRQGKTLHPVLKSCWSGIQNLTNTKCWQSNGEFRCVGVEEDVMMAMYLSEMLVGASKRIWTTYFEENGLEGRPFRRITTAREDLMRGFGEAVDKKMHELAAARATAQATTSSGSALVVVKKDVIRRTLKEMGVSLRKGGRDSYRAVDMAAYGSGFAQGASVNLNRPFGGHSDRGALK
jgi:hypothetical protein